MVSNAWKHLMASLRRAYDIASAYITCNSVDRDSQYAAVKMIQCICYGCSWFTVCCSDAWSSSDVTWCLLLEIYFCPFILGPRQMRCGNITGSAISNSTAGSGLEHALYKSRQCFGHLFFTSWPVSRFPCLSLITQTLDACFLVIFLTPSNSAKVTNVFFAWSLHLLAWYLADRWYASLSALRLLVMLYGENCSAQTLDACFPLIFLTIFHDSFPLTLLDSSNLKLTHKARSPQTVTELDVTCFTLTVTVAVLAAM